MSAKQDPTRRAFVGGAVAGGGAVLLGTGLARGISAPAGLQEDPVKLPDLPYEKTALAPHISEETLSYHYGKHHSGYVKKLNAALEKTPAAPRDLEGIIRKQKDFPGLFNNAAQIWNHTFYWNSLSPRGGGAPKAALAKALTASFGSVEAFQKRFSEQAAGLFGSGWAWLVKTEKGKLDILQTKDAGTPLTDGLVPLFTCDVWEHAYYIDYRNGRKAYIEAFWNLANWDFVEKNLG